MSIYTWKKEFYPTTASRVAKDGTIKCLEHSLQKWIGLRDTNLKKHKIDEVPIDIDDSTCALCQKFKEGCSDCPISTVHDNTHFMNFRAGCNNWFQKWRNNSNPEPMIAELKRVLKEHRK